MMTTNLLQKFDLLKMRISTQTIKFALFLLMLLITLVTLTNLLTEWHADWNLAHPKKAPAQIVKTSVTDDISHSIATIPQIHLFGEAITGIGNMPLSNLQLHLTGIVHSTGDSKAYIAIATHPGKIYRTGDQLPYGAKIFAITDDTVVLQNEGHLEKLTLPREKLQFRHAAAQTRMAEKNNESEYS